MSQIVLITGSGRSGKSRFAVELARHLRQPTLFLATCVPEDEEMRARVAAHRAERPAEWDVGEEAFALAPLLGTIADNRVVLLDCLPMWISNQLVRGDSDAAIAAACTELLGAMQQCAARRLLVVTAEVGAGLVPTTALGRRFRDLVGSANQQLAAIAERVYGLCCGRAIELPRSSIASIAAELDCGGQT